MKRRFFAMLLSLAMLFTLAPTAFAAESRSETPVTSGNCGAPNDETNTVTWSFDSTTGTLTISGNGAMANLNKSTETENISDGAGTYPWANLKDSIKNIVIGDGVTSIGSKAFIAYTNVTSVSIGKDVSEIGVGALSPRRAPPRVRGAAERVAGGTPWRTRGPHRSTGPRIHRSRCRPRRCGRHS